MRRRIVQGLVVVASTLGVVYATTVVTGDPTYSPTATVAPAITGTAEVGQELSCAPGTWKRSPTAYAIKWENAATSAEVATGSPYIVADTDEGDELRCRVTAANARGSGQSLSAAVGPVPDTNPLLIVSDSFADSNDTNLSAHVGEKGATWTKHPSLTRDTFITANRARGDGNTGRARYYASGVPASANYRVGADFYWQSAGVANALPAIFGRLSTAADTGYQVRWAAVYAGFEMVKVVSGVATRLGSVYADSPATGESRTVELEMLGPSIKMYVGGVVRVAVTDSAITAVGRAGVGTRTSTDTTGIHIESVQATLVSPSAPFCADGLDNDSDTFFDYPADAGCSDVNDNDETNAAPPDPLCDDGIDNDSPTDGLIDFPADPGCDDALDNDEYNEPPPPPPETPVGNFWVDPDGGTCARNTAPSEYDDATACATLQVPYAAASYGDVVYVRPGSYPAQTLYTVLTKASEVDEADVTFRPDGAAEIAGVLSYGLRHVTFDQMHFTSDLNLECDDNPPGTSADSYNPYDVSIINGVIVGRFYFENGNHILLSGNSIGPQGGAVAKLTGSLETAGADCTDEPPMDTIIEGNDFHDFRTPVEGGHAECIFVEGTQGLIIRRNKFRACEVFSLFFKSQLGGGPFGMSNILIENNWFGHPVAGTWRAAGADSISLSAGTYDNLTIQHNSINGDLQLRDDIATFTNTLVSGNLVATRAATALCGASGITWVGNAWERAGDACPNDLADGIAAGWVYRETQGEIDSPTAVADIDYHLAPGAFCIGAATTTSTEDYDQTVRPVDGTYDCGADEYEAP